MNILALDTCTEMCSAALQINGHIIEMAELTQRGHSEKILAMLDELFAQQQTNLKQIDAIAFGRGPGSFTGVRVGVGVAQGIAFARQLPVAPVSSLAAVAQQAIDRFNVDYIAVAMDARMGEIYAAHFKQEQGNAVLLDQEQVCPPTQFQPFNKQQKWFAAGTGWAEYDSTLTMNFSDCLDGKESALYPQASAMIKLAQVMAENNGLVAAEQAIPVYLRDNVAKKKREQV